MEEDEHRPPVRKYLPLWEHDVHVNSERYVFQHDEHIGGREAGENSVYGSCDHVFPRQHDDVQHVGQGAEQAHHQRHVAVVILVLDRKIPNGPVAVATNLLLAVVVARNRQIIHELVHVVYILVRDVQAGPEARTIHGCYTTNQMAQVEKGCVQVATVLVMYVARHRISRDGCILASSFRYLSFSISLLSTPLLPPRGKYANH